LKVSYNHIEEYIKELGLCLNDIPDMEEVCWNLFEELRTKGYKNLIIDIRGNRGGNSNWG
jgi:hypothetical protein